MSVKTNITHQRVPIVNLENGLVTWEWYQFFFNLFELSGGGSTASPIVTKTDDFSMSDTDKWVINNKAGSSCVVTLLAASANLGKELHFQNYQAQTLVSNASNVIPLGGGAAGTAILAASSSAWATLVSNGTDWVIMQAG